MGRLFQWVVDNKQWVFSGAGVFLVGFVLTVGRSGFRALRDRWLKSKEPSGSDTIHHSFDPQDLVVEFDDAPYLLLNFENHILSFTVRTTVTNFSATDLKITWGQCKPMISSFGFIQLEQTRQFSVSARRARQYIFEKQLTDGEVRRAIQLLEGADERLIRIQFHFLVETPSGGCEIHVPSKVTSIITKQIGEYQEPQEHMQNDLSIKDFKMAILKEIATAQRRPDHKFNLLGRPPGRGQLEQRLGITYTPEQRAQAVRAFDELKAADLIRPTYTDPVDPENWVDITEAGHETLRTGSFEPAKVASAGKFGVQDALLFLDKAKRAAESVRVVSALFLDLDNFKKVNDTYDHTTGDQVIREAIALVQQVIQGKGELFHRSGDEMMVLLPNFDDSEALSVAERIRTHIETNVFSTVGQGLITATIGVSTFPASCPDLTELEVVADRAAMRAKELGKNIVQSASNERPVAASQMPKKPTISKADLSSLTVLLEELTRNGKSLAGVTYGQLGGLADDQYRRLVVERVYRELPDDLRHGISAAYQEVRNVNEAISRAGQEYTPGGIESRNEVLRAKQQARQPIQVAADALKQFLS